MNYPRCCCPSVARRRVLVASLATAMLLLSTRSGALVFDFEDGTQGWTLLPGAVRSATTQLGGSYAIFGIDGVAMTIVLDVTDYDLLVLDFLFTGDTPSWSPQAIGLSMTPVDLQGNRRPGNRIIFPTPASLRASPQDPYPLPDRRAWDVSGATGVFRVALFWNSLSCIPEDLGPCFLPTFPGLVDNVTLVPESGGVRLLGLVGGWLWLRRRRRSRIGNSQCPGHQRKPES